MEQLPIERPEFLGDTMKKLRKAFEFRQSDVAKYLNVCRSTYSYYEENKTRPDPAVLWKLAKYYDVPVDVFNTEELDLDVSLSDVDGRRRRTSRTSGVNIEKVGDLRPVERSLILFLRANGINIKDVLESLEYRLKQGLEEDTQTKKPAPPQQED